MDPNENLKEQLSLAREIDNNLDGAQSHEAQRLAELVLSLNEWLVKGGFLPEVWTKGH